MGSPFAVLKPTSCCHVDDNPKSGGQYLQVSKKSSKQQWYWGDIRPIVRLSTRYTLHACKGLGPKFSPMCAHGLHLGIVDPEASSFWSANMGQPKVCACLRETPTLIELKSSMQDAPSLQVGIVLWSSVAFRSAYGQRAMLTACNQHCIA